MIARGLRWGAGLLLLLLLLLVALLLRGVDLSFAKPRIERALGAYLEREISIDGPTRIQVGRQIHVELGGLRMRFPEAEEPQLSLESAELRIRSASLLAERPEIDELLVSGLALTVTIDAEGQNNLPSAGTDGVDEDAGSRSLRPPVILHNATIRDVSFTRIDQRDGSRARLVVDELTQSRSDPTQSRLVGRGSLQDRPWALDFDLSSDQPLDIGKSWRAKLAAELADLDLNGELRLPSLEDFSDATLSLRLEGSVPPAIAALSPLLEAQAPMSLRADVQDVTPGITVDLAIDFERVDLTLAGKIDEPRRGDGLDLAMDLQLSSLNDVVELAGLSPSDDVPVAIKARLRRNGAELNLDGLTLEAGEHRGRGEAYFPAFPNIEDGNLDLLLAGPDFGLYQRLLDRPLTLARPYSTNLSLVARPDGPELLQSSLTVGDHRLAISGPLGDLPQLTNSDIEFRLQGPDLDSLARNFDIALPAMPYEASGRLRVTGDGIVQLRDLDVQGLDASISASGDMRGYPDFDEIQMALQATVPSLKALSERLDREPLGAVPAQASLNVSGDLEDLLISDVSITAGSVRADASGALRLSGGQLSSDLAVQIDVKDLPELLGSLAPEGMPSPAVAFQLRPSIVGDRLRLDVDEIVSEHLRGSLSLDMGTDFALDADTSLSADLEILSLARLVPAIEGYRPPDRPFTVAVRNGRNTSTRSIDLAFGGEGTDLIAGTLTLPESAGGDIALSLAGVGDDLSAFGSIAGVSEEPLPYDLAAEITGSQSGMRADIARLRLAGSELKGRVSATDNFRSWSVDLEVPQAELERWLVRRETDATTPPESQAPERGTRLIPDTPLPLELLDRYRVDLRLNTGPLGVRDPVFTDASLIDELQLTLTNDAGDVEFEIEKLRGSRGELSTLVSIFRESHNRISADLELAVTGFPASLGGAGGQLNTLPRHDLLFSADAQGSTPRQLAASLNGALLVTGGPGKIKSTALQFATNSFFDKLFEALLPPERRPTEVLVECSVLALAAEDGVVTLDPGLVFRSERIDLSARGSLDLNNERLVLRFDNQARRGLGISAASLVNPYVQVTGTLARPRVGLDLASGAVAGGAAVATGGLTVIAQPLLGRFLRMRNPCDVALKRWEERGSG